MIVFLEDADLFSILNQKRSNQLIFNKASPYYYPTSTLLVSDSKWRSVPVTDPATGPSIWSVKSHKNLSSDISLPSLDASAYMSCSVVVGLKPSLPWPCLWALQVGCSYGIWQNWKINDRWVPGSFMLDSSHFLRPCWLFATKRLMVLWSRPDILAISIVLHPHEGLFVIFDF